MEERDEAEKGEESEEESMWASAAVQADAAASPACPQRFITSSDSQVFR